MSKFAALNWADFAKGLLIAVLATILTSLLPILQNGAFPDWPTFRVILFGGLSAGIAYIIKNFFTNSQNQFGKKEAA